MKLKSWYFQEKIKEIFGKKFMYEMLSEIHMKLYNFSGLEIEVETRKEFKEDFTYKYRKKAKDYEDKKTKQELEEDERIEKRASLVPASEIAIVQNIVDNFVFESDAKHQDQLDLTLALKSLPARIDEYNCYRVELFNFSSMQQAIIAS